MSSSVQKLWRVLNQLESTWGIEIWCKPMHQFRLDHLRPCMFSLFLLPEKTFVTSWLPCDKSWIVAQCKVQKKGIGTLLYCPGYNKSHLCNFYAFMFVFYCSTSTVKSLISNSSSVNSSTAVVLQRLIWWILRRYSDLFIWFWF